jgi:hypothetical protein
MICLGHGTVDWSAVSAVGTLLASAIALLASWLALKAPQWSKQADRRESTQEVLAASNEALKLYDEAYALTSDDQKWPTVTVLRIKSIHLHETLNRLIARPSLTDGAITVGAGAMSILAMLQSLETVEEIRQKRMARITNSKEGRIVAMMTIASTPAKETIEAAQELVDVVRQRIRRVEIYIRTG